jgi:hypothetical protein
MKTEIEMKNWIFTGSLLFTIVWSQPMFSQPESAEDLLGLPGDNLDLYAVLDVFQKSPTIEEFEKSLNDSDTKINNLDLNLDEKVDFIKVTTVQKDDDFSFVLQTDVTEKETQDVAVILLSKDEAEKVTLQIVGDEELYGKNFVIEPKPSAPAATANPGYTGTDPVPATTSLSTVIAVESAPVVQYVYSPVYVPYYPPYHYGYYPVYFSPFTVIAVGIYRSNHYYYHAPYHGGYGNTTVVVHNHNTYNNYHNTRNTSNTVNHHNTSGNYNRGNTAGGGTASTRPSGSTPDRSGTASGSPANKPTGGAGSGATNKSTTSTHPSGGHASGSASRSQASAKSPGASSASHQSAAGSRSGSYQGAGRSGGGYSGAGRSGASRGGGRR